MTNEPTMRPMHPSDYRWRQYGSVGRPSIAVIEPPRNQPRPEVKSTVPFGFGIRPKPEPEWYGNPS